MARIGSDGKDSKNITTQDILIRLWRRIRLNMALTIYLFLAVGLVLLLARPVLGGAIIGFVAGYVFSGEIMRYAISLKNTIEHEAVLRGVILGVVLIAFIIEAPAIIISAAIAIGVRRLTVQR